MNDSTTFEAYLSDESAKRSFLKRVRIYS